MPATSSALHLADLALVWDEQIGSADLVMIDDDLASDAGLETAVELSLFTDRRAESDNAPPSGDPNDRRGYWGDQFSAVEGDKFGSRIWLLDRAKATNETALSWKEYALEALAWMTEDGVVSGVDVATQLTGQRLDAAVTLSRPNKSPLTIRFAHVWDAMTT